MTSAARKQQETFANRACRKKKQVSHCSHVFAPSGELQESILRKLLEFPRFTCHPEMTVWPLWPLGNPKGEAWVCSKVCVCVCFVFLCGTPKWWLSCWIKNPQDKPLRSTSRTKKNMEASKNKNRNWLLLTPLQEDFNFLVGPMEKHTSQKRSSPKVRCHVAINTAMQGKKTGKEIRCQMAIK